MALAMLLGAGAKASAATITFGTGLGEINPGAVGSYATTVGGTTMTVLAQPNATFTTTSGGLGITNGPFHLGAQADEAEAPEYFQILFAAPATNVVLNLSKFFKNDGASIFNPSGTPEIGLLSVNGVAQPNFVATSTTGTYLLDLSLFGPVSSLTVTGAGVTSFFPFVSSELALRSVQFDAAPVPEPLTLSLLGFGLVGVGVRLRRRARA